MRTIKAITIILVLLLAGLAWNYAAGCDRPGSCVDDTEIGTALVCVSTRTGVHCIER